jgi:fatty acid elongase 3
MDHLLETTIFFKELFEQLVPMESSKQIQYKNWDWSQLWNPSSFEWKRGITPLSDFGVVVQSILLYFSVIIGLKLVMKNREPMKLKMVTAIHNLFLSIGSLGMWIAAILGAHEIYVKYNGIKDVYCSNEVPPKGLLHWALYTYYLSKFPELIDTVILVLKKKPVIFLHWYHHSSVIILTWVWLDQKISFGVFPMILNTLVHVFMYYYYFASNIGMNVWYKVRFISPRNTSLLDKLFNSFPIWFLHRFILP